MTSVTSGEGVLSPFSGLGIFMSLIQGRRAPLCACPWLPSFAPPAHEYLKFACGRCRPLKQTDNFLFSAQGCTRNTAAERPEEGSQGWSTQRSEVRNPWSTEVLKLVALKGRQQWLIVEGAFRQSISKCANLAQLKTRHEQGLVPTTEVPQTILRSGRAQSAARPRCSLVAMRSEPHRGSGGSPSRNTNGSVSSSASVTMMNITNGGGRVAAARSTRRYRVAVLTSCLDQSPGMSNDR
jgi:hypothetical protein